MHRIYSQDKPPLILVFILFSCLQTSLFYTLMFKLQNLFNIIIFCVPHKIQDQARLAKNKVNILLIQFYRTLDLSKSSMELYLECKH